MRHRSSLSGLAAVIVLAISLTLVNVLPANAATSSARGALDDASWSGGKVRVAGWAIVDSWERSFVHLYVDGSLATFAMTNFPREDVEKIYPGRGDKAGFVTEIAAAGGSHLVCAYALTPEGDNPLLGCRTVVVPTVPVGAPFGALDVLSLKPGAVIVHGWATDPDASNTPVEVHVYVDGALKAGGIASDARADVAAAFPYGANHGYSIEISLDPGEQQVCTYGINATGSVGVNALLACTTTNRTGDPVGNITLGSTGMRSGSIIPWRIEGFLVDPDTSAPIEVHLYRFPWIDALATPPTPSFDRPELIGNIRADASPPASIPSSFISSLVAGFGSDHGFSIPLAYDFDHGLTCAYAVNAPGTPGKNYLLGCAGTGVLRPVDGRP